MNRYRFLLPLLFILVACGNETPVSDTPVSEQPVAAVAMPDSYAVKVAMTVLEGGGNAVDASIAAAFSLAVTKPDAGNIGGGGFMLVYLDGAANFIDYRETAPRLAHRDMYLDENGEVIENASLVGHRAAGIPGTVAGMWLAHQRYGTIAWADLLAPAVALARDGFVVHPIQAEELEDTLEFFADKVNFADHFGAMRAGETFRQPELAKTLERIAAIGPDDFYRGETARLLVAEMERGGGLITMDDLNTYKVVERKPLRADWRDVEILAAPPPSSAGFAIVQLLKMKDYLAPAFEGHGHNSAQYVHLVAEMEKRVFADRAEYLGDPDYYDVPMDELLDEAYLRRRALEVNEDEISTLDAAKPGLESMETTHFSVIDQWGNAVANTYTLNGSYGNGVVVEGAGFLLNNEMDDFSVKPGVPNMYGVVGSVANEIQPGKRMLSSMAPTILLRDGAVEMVLGTPGGSTIFTTVFQAIISIYDFGMTPAEAAGASRFHHQLLPPDLVTYSPTVPLPEETIGALSDAGYRVEPHSYNYGDLQIIYAADGDIQAGSDPRFWGESKVLSRK
jgi:gamma-glutamyltranspeptidase/glutathione hydrolase